MSYNLFLDDERDPVDPAVWYLARNYEEFCDIIIEYGQPSYISFDHDLGSGKTGYDCAKFLVDYCLDRNIRPSFVFYVHSQNPVGKMNIEGLLNNFKSAWW